MNLLRKCLGRARISCSNRDESGDNNEHDDNKSAESTQHVDNRSLRSPGSEYRVKMLGLIRELAIFCLVYMALGAIMKDPPKVSKAPAAYPFFPKNSLVKDFYRGQIVAAIEHSWTADISFIMFYAPWDAESQAARKEFLIAAEYMKDNIIFTAVDCWQPNSECKNRYSKVYRWPVLIVYPSFGTGFQYNGPISAPHMISFLQKLMRPIKRINETNLIFEEAFVVAELNCLPGSIEYSVYYITALKYLEADYTARVSFYVKPVKFSQNKISLYLWNQVRVLDIEPGGWKVDTLLQWIIKTTELPSSWVTPTGSKSLVLSDHLQAAPSLILFTPKNPLQPANDYYMMLQEIAQEFKNCDNWGLSFDMKSKRLNNLLEYSKLKKTCHFKQNHSKLKKISSVTTSVPFLNSSSRLNKETGGKIEVDWNAFGLSPMTIHQGCDSCFDVPYFTAANSDEDTFSTGAFRNSELLISTSMLRQDSDPKSVQNLRKRLRKERCKAFLTAEKLQAALFEPESNSERVDVSNLGCSNSNQSLNFVTMDSLMYSVFAERLGVDLLVKNDRSAVVILNEKMESHYIMQEPISSKNIRLFITNFLNNTLSRSLDSIVDIPLRNSSSFNYKFKPKGDVVIDELYSKNFLEAVLEENKAVLVLYYSKQCSFCNGISYTFLTVARKLSFVKNIRFTRIEGDENLLPWEYTMEEFPTILFFPSFRKEETRVFPSTRPINVPNLLGFILSNLDCPAKLHAMYSVCLNTQLPKDKNTCLTSLRNETIVLIEKTLRDWRKSNNRQRQLVLHNLKQLRQLQFLFSHAPEDYLLIEKYIRRLKVYLNDDYSQNSIEPVKDEL